MKDMIKKLLILAGAITLAGAAYMAYQHYCLNQESKNVKIQFNVNITDQQLNNLNTHLAYPAN